MGHSGDGQSLEEQYFVRGCAGELHLVERAKAVRGTPIARGRRALAGLGAPMQKFMHAGAFHRSTYGTLPLHFRKVRVNAWQTGSRRVLEPSRG